MKSALIEQPWFVLTLRTPFGRMPDYAPVQFVSLEAAYCDICAAIPDTAAALLREGVDPMACSYLICDLADTVLMDVPFSDLVRRRDRGTPKALEGAAASGRTLQLVLAMRQQRERARRAYERAADLTAEANRLTRALTLLLGNRAEPVVDPPE